MLSRLLPAALLLGQLPMAAFALPIARRSSAMAEWTLRGFHWKCSPDKSLCIYGFSLAEEPAPGAPAETPAFCHFAIHANDDEPVDKTGFSNIPCENLSQYRVGSTFGDNGYMILSVENIDEQRRAYFNFNVSELENSEMAAAQQSVAYAVTAPPSPDYTDEDSEHDTDDFDLTPVITRPIFGDNDDSDSTEELLVTEDASELENLAALINLDTLDDTDANGDSYGDNNSDDNDYDDYNDYKDGPVIELAEVDTTEEEADDYSDPSDANIIAAVEEPTEEDADVADNEPAEVVFEAAYTAEVPSYDDDESYDNTDKAAETTEAVDEPVLASVADLDDGYANDNSEDADYADNGYAAGDEQADENLVVSPDDAIVTVLDTPSYTPDSESSDANDYDDNSSGYDATTILSVPAIPELWAMRNISRQIQYDPNSIFMQFAIDVLPDGPKSIPCTLHVDLDKNVDPLFASWFVEQCEDSGWFLSWGYNQLTESAVVTLINPERTEEAWFGWNSVNANFPDTMLNSVGPGIVQTCNC